MLSRLRTMVRALLHRRGFEDGLAEEVRFHIDQYTRDLIAAGHSPAEAARRARIEFGSIDNVTLDCRAARGLHPFDALQQHVRYAARLLRKSPGFTATALATLAICLGAALAIFAVVDAVLLRPLPFPDADRLVAIYNTYPKAGVQDDGATVTNYYERRKGVAGFSSVSLYRDGAAIVGEVGSNEREYITLVSPDFFSTLGAGLAKGRAFTEAETSYETAKEAIVTDTYWRDHLAADPNIVGRALRMDGLRITIVGVLPPDFRFLSSKRGIYVPLASSPEDRGPDRRHSGSSSHMIARLQRGVSIAEAQAAIDAHNTVMERSDPEAQMMADAGFRSVVIPLHAAEVASVRPTLLLLQAAVLGLLLIGAVNVTNLFLIRASGRSRELALRRALGAAQHHIIAEVLVETTLLTLAGGVLGLGIGAAGIRLLRALGASHLPLGAQVAFDARVAIVALAASMVIGLVIAAPIAWCSMRSAAVTVGAESRTTTASRGAQRLRHAFLVTQVAVAFILLAGSGLLALSLQAVTSVAPGFRPEQVLTGQIALPWKSYPDTPSKLTFIGRLMDALAGEPGVVASGIATNVPFSGNTNKSSATVEGYVPPPGAPPRGVYSYAVAGDYFRAMGIPLIQGRLLSRSDDRPDGNAVVVDEDFARIYWPRHDAIGHRLYLGSSAGKAEEAYVIVGVVGAVKQAGLASDEALGAVYYPYSGRFDSNVYVISRTATSTDALAARLQRIVRQLDPELPVNNLRPMQTRIDDSLLTRRSPALLSVLFAIIALMLTAIGTYGVLSYAVTLRRREIGVRMALGAQPGQVRREFVAVALRLLAAGTIVGVAGAWATGHAMGALLYRVEPVNWPLLALAALLLGAVCLTACLLPSHRASRISPTEALAEL